MKTKGRIKPSKPVALGQMVGCGAFAIIGLTVIIPAIKENGGPMWLGVLWTLLTAAGSIVGAYNLFSEEGIATDEFSYTSEPQTPDRSTKDRLGELKELKESGLISTEEYESKRSHLLNRL